ncbi:MAG: AMP-binding protein [Firmicutes bacterium]|nr:AMP-binding protein [Bacillota bacterium]
MTPEEKLQALNKVLKLCGKAPFYHNRIPDRALTALEEIKDIPLTTKEELRLASPFGLVCVPREELCQYHESFGTTGEPVSTWLTREDLRDNARQITRCGVDFSKEDKVLVRFPYAISAVAHMVHTAAQLKGACVVPASARSDVSPLPRIIDLLRRLDVTVMACLPLQALLLAETAEMLGLRPDLDFPALRAVCTAGEPLAPGRREMLQSIWKTPVFDFYGMAEIGTAVVDCRFGRSHPLEEYFIFELLDDNFEAEVPTGATGHLVVTTLNKRAAPMLRYLTGDRARKAAGKCRCGKDLHLEIRGRQEDIITTEGRVWDLWDLEDIVSGFACRRYWAVGPGSPGLRFVVEEEKTGDAVGPEAIRGLEKKYGCKIDVEVVPRGTLYDRSELFAVSEVGKPRYIYTENEMRQRTYGGTKV